MSERCASCFYRECDRCYHGNPPRDEKGRSRVLADGKCKAGSYKNKRAVMRRNLIPAVALALASHPVIGKELEEDET